MFCMRVQPFVCANNRILAVVCASMRPGTLAMLCVSASCILFAPVCAFYINVSASTRILSFVCVTTYVWCFSIGKQLDARPLYQVPISRIARTIEPQTKRGILLGRGPKGPREDHRTRLPTTTPVAVGFAPGAWLVKCCFTRFPFRGSQTYDCIISDFCCMFFSKVTFPHIRQSTPYGTTCT